MLTKTLKFDPATLDTLKAMTWENDGKLGKITTQLDRPAYVAVNKALEAMGGRWNRSAGGHVFATDPRPQVEGLLDSGSLIVERDGFFETPEVLAERMVQLAEIKTWEVVLEPSAGLGAIARYIKLAHPANLHVCEKNADRANVLVSEGYILASLGFLEYTPRFHGGYDKIVMNPPFEEGQDVDHVLHAYELLNPGGRIVAIMAPHAFFATDKKSVSFREWFSGSVEDLPAGTFKASGTMVSAKLVIIDKPNGAQK